MQPCLGEAQAHGRAGGEARSVEGEDLQILAAEIGVKQRGHPHGLDQIDPRLDGRLQAFGETPAGGALFATSSIAWCGSLSHNGYDNNISRITANVLKRFLDPTPFS